MKKSAYLSLSFQENLIKYKPKQKVYSRNTQITPQAVNKVFIVHNGLTFLPVTVSEEMVGHKLGEFAQTRRRYYFKKKQIQKKKKK